MREIKFRGKRTHNRDWVYGNYFYSIEHKHHLIIPPDSIDAFPVDPETVGQFTGLHDKHEKEIYEGDKLFQKTTEEFKKYNSSVWEETYLVKFGEHDWRSTHAGYNTIGFFLQKINGGTCIGINQYDLTNPNYPFEVIGDIYEP